MILVAFNAMLVCGCDDPKRESELRWREEEVSAKVADVAKREQEIAARLREIEGERISLKQKEAALAVRLQEVAKLEEAAQRAKVEFETKARRGPAPATTSERILVIDPELPDVPLFERAASRKGAIASTTKIMTALILAEAGDLDKIVTVEQSDTECAPVRMGLKKGETYTRRNLLTALMVKSSNDIAQALARDNAGSVEAFVAKMNARAKELGCQNTLFINPNGLPPVKEQPDPFSTAIDLAKITMVADKIPAVREMVKLKSYWFEKPDGKKIPLENTNRVLRTCEFCDGFKTGYTSAAGYCLVATGEREGRRRIVVVLNGTKDSVWRDAQALLEWALRV
ncbi:MAG: serine hydrolase [Verrucomicrobiaceae bacterium]|nr:serine hydrolase [Verrucomicrobiaceae bacterium]